MSWELGLDPILLGVVGGLRILFFLVTGPIFGHRVLSARVRIILSLLSVFVIAPRAAAGGALDDLSALGLAFLALNEIAIGFVMGVTANLIFGAFLLFGQFAATQGGLGMAREIDPLSGVSTTALGTVLNTIGALVFLAIDGHHQLLRALSLSFDRLPIGGEAMDIEVVGATARLAAMIFEVGFRLAAPLTVAIFVENVAFGILGKAMPQLNLMMLNLPVHIGILFVMLGLGAPEVVHAMKGVLEDWPSRVLLVMFGV